MNNLREEEFSFEGDFRVFFFFLFIVLGSVDSGPVMRQNIMEERECRGDCLLHSRPADQKTVTRGAGGMGCDQV